MNKKHNKFILLHLGGGEEAETFFAEEINQKNMERGVIIKTQLGQEIVNHFEILKNRGYFPVAIIVDQDDITNVEFCFKRHPNQPELNKLIEKKYLNQTEL